MNPPEPLLELLRRAALELRQCEGAQRRLMPRAECERAARRPPNRVPVPTARARRW